MAVDSQLGNGGSYQSFHWRHARGKQVHRYLHPVLFSLCPVIRGGLRVLDVGCGNGYTLGLLLEKGCCVTGVDVSETGIEVARRTHPDGRFEVAAADERLAERFAGERFDLVISTEVVEHLYDPRSFARGCFRVLRPGGRLIVSTPYHGWLKNLVISIAGRWDSHANPLWDGGHIKLWSRRTLAALLLESGFGNLRFRGAGRVPYMWKSMVMACDKPCGES